MNNHIRIRQYCSEDVDSLHEAVLESKAELVQWMPWCHAGYSREDSLGWVESRSSAWERNEEWSFVIVDADDKFLGGCGIHRIDLRNSVAELGYWVRTSATNQGVATAATQLLARWAFEKQNLHRLEILTVVENRLSQRVAEKVGASREGVLKQRFLLNHQRHDAVLFALVSDID